MNLLRKIRALLLRVIGLKFYRSKVAGVAKIEEVDANSNLTFFGYYDQSCVNSNGDVVYLKIEGKLGLVMLKTSHRSREIGRTTAWNWQQGCMLHWIEDDQVGYNYYDEVGDRYLLRVQSTKDGSCREFDYPIQALSNVAEEYVSLSYDNLRLTRPDYGYSCRKEPLVDPDLVIVSTRDGRVKQRIKADDLCGILGISTLNIDNVRCNHVVYSPTKQKFIFLFRYTANQKTFHNLMLHDDGNVSVLSKNLVSHYCWLNSDQIIYYGEDDDQKLGYHFLDITTYRIEASKSWLTDKDGHPILLNEHTILTDTYPGKDRFSRIMKHDLKRNVTETLFEGYNPWCFWGEKRVDHHLKRGNNKSTFYFESGHSGQRKLYKLTLK